jgi:alkylation response protein AidB-like acyl-CoA dehydrogenase
MHLYDGARFRRRYRRSQDEPEDREDDRQGRRRYLYGIKTWPNNAGIASHYIVVTTVGPSLEDKGSAMVVVEKDTPGLSFGKIERKVGIHED